MTTYLSCGVNINAAQELVKRLKSRFPQIGGFGGLYPLGDQYLVAGADGVGTKLKIACQQQKYDTIGIDLVAMCVNDILTTGAKPLFFLDYFATSKLDIEQATLVLEGIIKGCEASQCLLLGGETAQMPGMYQAGVFDLCGFAVGIVSKDKLIDGKSIVAGDKLVALPSSGIHSNGYSLIRKLLEEHHVDLTFETELKDNLLIPTRIYYHEISTWIEHYVIKGICHVTGGGLIENVPRILPEHLKAIIDTQTWQPPTIFNYFQQLGSIEKQEMYRTFNMGVGLVVVLESAEAARLCSTHSECLIIGEVAFGHGVDLC